ncbi:tyrosine phosphatase family-domain-containing protein [Poronia punctata]|nr:tyrosine phosphatase family-domain-containing protein [Poronia punctata]
MGGSHLFSGQLVTDTPYEGEPRPVFPEAHDERMSRSFEVTQHQVSLAKAFWRESQNCTKRLLLGRPSVSSSYPPPVNFSEVINGLYRSGYPQPEDFPFLQALKLKTIVTLVSKELPDGYREFMQANHITHRVFDMAGTKKEEIPVELMRSIIQVVSNPQNYPLLIHCNHGKHRTGCVVGVLRKSNHWDMKRIIDEYSAFAEPKVRETDLKYLADFELTSLSLLRKPRATKSPLSPNRFYRVVLLIALLFFVYYPLCELKIQEKRHRLS